MRVLAFLALFAVSPAVAQEVQDIDVDEIEYCLGEAGYSGPAKPEDCMGFITDACQEDPVTGGPGSAVDCAMREAAAWMEIADKRMEALRDRLKPDIMQSTVAAQAAWEAYRDAHCDATGAFFYQYSGSASAQWQAACLRDITAERVLLLDNWLMRSEDFQ